MSGEITVRELVDRMYAATQRMSGKNPHRALMLHAMSAIIQLSANAPEKPEPKPLVELVQ